MAESRNITVFLKGNTKNLQKAFDFSMRGMRKFGQSMGNMSRKAGMALTAFGAVATGVLVKSVSLFNEQARVEKQLEAVLKSTGNAAGLTAEELKKYASSLQEVTTFGDEAIISGQNILLTFTGLKGDVLKDTTAIMLDMSEALGTSLTSSATMLGKALNDPIAGLSALSRAGVVFTDEQKKMIKTMAAAGDVAGAQKLMLQELQVEFGGSARAAAETFGGSLKQLKNTWGDLLEMIGGLAIPVLQKVVDKTKPIIESIMDWIKNQDDLAGKIETFVFETLATLKTAFLEVWEFMKPIVDKIKEWIKSNPELAAKIGSFAAVLALLSPILGPLLIVLPSLAGAFTLLSNPLVLIAGAAGIGWKFGTLINDWIKSVPILDGLMKAWYNTIVKVVNKLSEWLGLKEKAVDDKFEAKNRASSRAEFFANNPDMLVGNGSASNHMPAGSSGGAGTVNVFVNKMEDAKTTIDEMTKKIGLNNTGKNGRVSVS